MWLQIKDVVLLPPFVALPCADLEVNLQNQPASG
jgi:hypothetical protein